MSLYRARWKVHSENNNKYRIKLDITHLKIAACNVTQPNTTHYSHTTRIVDIEDNEGRKRCLICISQNKFISNSQHKPTRHRPRITMFQCLRRKQTQTLSTLEDLLTMFRCPTKNDKRPLRTFEGWLKGIKHIKDPLELTSFLFSDWSSSTDKVKILLLVPKMAFCNDVGMKLLESRLEDPMYAQLAQLVRWLIFSNGFDSSQKRDLNGPVDYCVRYWKAPGCPTRNICPGGMKALQKSLTLLGDSTNESHKDIPAHCIRKGTLGPKQ